MRCVERSEDDAETSEAVHDRMRVDDDRAVAHRSAIAEEGDISGSWRRAVWQLGAVARDPLHELIRVRVEEPIHGVLADVRRIHDAGGGVTGDEELGAVHADAHEASSVVKRRTEKAHSRPNNGAALGVDVDPLHRAFSAAGTNG
jgi:hypothetical protein